MRASRWLVGCAGLVVSAAAFATWMQATAQNAMPGSTASGTVLARIALPPGSGSRSMASLSNLPPGPSENAWDFTMPDGVPGFGPLSAADAERILALLQQGTAARP